jgi:hypothetical protein
MARIDVEKRERALTLRAAGLGYARIGKELGCSTARAAKIVGLALKDLLAAKGDTGECARELELARLDSLLLAVWPAAQKGDLDAWDRALAAITVRARLQGIGSKAGGKASAPSVVVQIVERTLEDARKTVTVVEQPATLPLPAVADAPAGDEAPSQPEPHPDAPDAANGVLGALEGIPADPPHIDPA